MNTELKVMQESFIKLNDGCEIDRQKLIVNID